MPRKKLTGLVFATEKAKGLVFPAEKAFNLAGPGPGPGLEPGLEAEDLARLGRPCARPLGNWCTVRVAPHEPAPQMLDLGYENTNKFGTIFRKTLL